MLVYEFHSIPLNFNGFFYIFLGRIPFSKIELGICLYSLSTEEFVEAVTMRIYIDFILNMQVAQDRFYFPREEMFIFRTTFQLLRMQIF